MGGEKIHGYSARKRTPARYRRVRFFEPLETRALLSVDLMLTNSPWQNPADPVDVNNDGEFSAIDILVVLNHIEVHSEGSVSEDDYGAPLFPDVNGDLNVTPIDALLQMNYLNALEAGLPNPGLSASSMPGSSSSSASSSSSSREESDYATMMTASGGPSEPSCPLDYLPPSIDVWFRDAATGDVIDHVVEGQRFLLDTRVLESLPCPSGMIGDRVGWDIDWGDGTTTSTNGTGPVVSGHQAAFDHVYLDDNPTDTPSDIYHITVIGSDKDGTGVLPISFLVKNVAPKVTITSITPIDSVPESKGGVNGRLDETEGFKVEGTVTDPGVLDTFPVAKIEVDLNFDGSIDPNTETFPVTLQGGNGSWTFDVTVGPILDDGKSGIWDNETVSDDLKIEVKITDDDTGEGTANDTVLAYNVAPMFVGTPTVEFQTDPDGVVQEVRIKGKFFDHSILDAHDVLVTWGDNDSQTVRLDPGATQFDIVRPIDPNYEELPELYPVSVKVTDDDTGFVTTAIEEQCGCSGGSCMPSAEGEGAAQGDMLVYGIQYGSAPVIVDGTWKYQLAVRILKNDATEGKLAVQIGDFWSDFFAANGTILVHVHGEFADVWKLNAANETPPPGPIYYDHADTIVSTGFSNERFNFSGENACKYKYFFNADAYMADPGQLRFEDGEAAIPSPYNGEQGQVGKSGHFCSKLPNQSELDCDSIWDNGLGTHTRAVVADGTPEVYSIRGRIEATKDNGRWIITHKSLKWTLEPGVIAVVPLDRPLE